MLKIPAFGNTQNAPNNSPKNSNYSFDLTAIRKTIEDKNYQFTQAHVKGDSATIDHIFTEDARSFPPNSKAAIGLPAISVLTSEYMKFGIKQFDEETTKLSGNKDYIIDEGNYSMIYDKDNTIEKGKYLNVWKNVNGNWRLYSNIWNTNPPDILPK